MTELASDYLNEIRRQLRGHKRMAESAMAQLEDKEFFTAIDPESNSVAILVKHIAGNARSRFTDFLTTDGEKPDRFRDQEFEISNDTTREEVMRWWEEGWSQVFSTLDSLRAEDVSRTVTIRQEPHTVMQALNRALATTPSTLDKSCSCRSICVRRNGRPSAFREASQRSTNPVLRRDSLAGRTMPKPDSP
jgi:hypothetical protein